MSLGERSPQSPMDISGLEAGFSMRESITWRLLDIARGVDLNETRGLLSNEGLLSLVAAQNLLGIAVLNAEGKSLYHAGSVPGKFFRS